MMAERNYYDDLLGKGAGDPDNIRFIGEDKAVVNRLVDDTHWSDLPKPGSKAPDFPSWYDQDNNPASPLEQDKE